MTQHEPVRRVLHATECLAAGTLDVVRSLINALSERGVEQVLIFSRRPETPSDVEAQFGPKVRLVEVRHATGFNIAFCVQLSRAIRREVATWKPDHVHLHSSRAGFVGRLSLRTVTSATTVLYSPHGLSFLDSTRPLMSRVCWLLEKFASTRSSLSVACSPGEGELLRRLTGRSGYILENPVDDCFFNVEHGHSSSSIVATVGRISRQKAPDTFAALAKRIRTVRPGTRMMWVGDGDAQMRAKLLDAGCEVTGWQSREEVCRILASTDVYVQTSRWEGLPISLIQAMACGNPAVVTNVVGNRDAVEHGKSGFVAEDVAGMARHVEQLLAESTLRLSAGRLARQEAMRRFSQKTFKVGVYELYGLALSSESAPSPRNAGHQQESLNLFN